MTRPQIVNLILEDLSEDEYKLVEYIEQIEKERDELKDRVSVVLETNQKLNELLSNNWLFTNLEMAEHNARLLETNIPVFKDPLTRYGDPREDTQYRMGWNACRDKMKRKAEEIRLKAQES